MINSMKKFVIGEVGSSQSENPFIISENETPRLDEPIEHLQIASRSELEKIRLLTGFNQNLFNQVAIRFAIICGNNSSSPLAEFKVNIKIGDSEYSADEFARAIKNSGITVRKFCAAYVHHVWDYFIRRGTPPDCWAAKGFPENLAYASIDFLFAFGSAAALPKANISRKPTADEMSSNVTNARVNIYRSETQKGNTITNAPEITKGRVSRGPTIQLLGD